MADPIEEPAAPAGGAPAPSPPRPAGGMTPGGLVEAAAHLVGADRLAKLWEGWTGRGCGCGGRKAAIDAAYARLRAWLGRRRG